MSLLLLVALLDAPSYRVREAAHAGLKEVAPAVALAWGEGHLSPEGRARCRTLLAAHCARNAEAVSKSLGPLPSIEFLPDDFPGRAELIDDLLDGAYAGL